MRKYYIILGLVILLSACTSYRKTNEEKVRKKLEYSVAQYNKMALAKADSQRYDLAIDILREALYLTPWDPELFLNLGSMFYYNDQLDSAEFMFKRATLMRPSFAMAYTNLSKVYIKQKKYKQALDAVDNAIEQDPEFSEAWLTKSEIYLENNLIDDAVTLLKEQTEKEPDISEYHSQLGYIYQKTGLIDDAINEYLYALNIDPGASSIYFNLGNAFFQQCRLGDAQSAFLQAIELDTTIETTYNNYSLVLINMEQYRDAIRTLNKALEKNPKSSVVLFNLSIAMDRVKNYDKALEYINKAIERDSSRIVFYVHKGNMLKKTNKLEEALKEYENALNIDSNSTTAYNNLGNTLMLLGRIDEANLAYQKSIELYTEPSSQPNTSSLDHVDKGITMVVGWCSDPYRIYKEYAMLYNNLGKARILSGQISQAKQAFKIAINYNPDFVEGYQNLAAVYFQLDQKALGKDALSMSRIKAGDLWYDQQLYQAAREQYLDAQKIDPTLPLALAKMALLNKRLGQDISAIQYKNAKKAIYEDTDMYVTLAEYCQLDENPEDALKYYKKAIELSPASLTALSKAADFCETSYPELAKQYKADVHFLKGKALNFANLDDAAVEQYKQAVALDSTHINSSLALAVLYMKKNHMERAKDQYNRVLRIDPENSKAMLGLGTLYGNQQQFDKAIAYLQQTLIQDSTNAQAHYTLGVNYYFLNDLDNALEHTQKAQKLGIEINNEFLQKLLDDKETKR